MYKATRLLIEERLKHSKYNLQKVSVKLLPIGEINKCHQNTFKFQSSDVLRTGCRRSVAVSGWLVGKYERTKDGAEIIQHWWNIDSVTKQHFDTTPVTDSIKYGDYEYVTDFEFSIFGNEGHVAIDSNACKSICLRQGKWYLVHEDKDGNLVYKLTNKLNVESFFRI